MGNASYGILKNAQACERERGLRFCETFENATEVVNNGGVITGSPVVNNGATLDGINDYIISAIDNLNYANGLSYEFKFIPNFAKNDNVFRHIFDTEALSRYYIFRDANSNILFNVGNLNITVIYADYQGYWNDFEENTISFKADSSTGKIYLNNNEIKSFSTTSWNKSSPSQIVLGARNTTFASKFDGTIISSKWFNKALTAQELANYYNNTIFKYEESTEVNLPMGLAQHDPDNDRALDMSGNGNNATVNGCVKLQKRGYSFDGVDDYFSDLPTLSGDYTVCVFVDNKVEFYNTNTVYNSITTSGAFAGNLQGLTVYNILLTDMQKADIKSKLMIGVNRK